MFQSFPELIFKITLLCGFEIKYQGHFWYFWNWSDAGLKDHDILTSNTFMDNASAYYST